jgi:hypothetical protein
VGDGRGDPPGAQGLGRLARAAREDPQQRLPRPAATGLAARAHGSLSRAGQLRGSSGSAWEPSRITFASGAAIARRRVALAISPSRVAESMARPRRDLRRRRHGGESSFSAAESGGSAPICSLERLLKGKLREESRKRDCAAAFQSGFAEASEFQDRSALAAASGRGFGSMTGLKRRGSQDSNLESPVLETGALASWATAPEGSGS